ncbi:MAG: outer membrane beta-barrel protein [Balneolia bacterium]|nr:outer membrane beta-barrel protein [Balneolia bacterium]
MNASILPFLSILFLLFSCAGQLKAQAVHEWKVGFSIDRTSLDIANDNLFLTPQTSFSISVQPVFRVNEDFSLITGLEYSYFNYSMPSFQTGTQLLDEAGNPHVSYLNLPLLVNMHFLENLRELNFTAGFRISRRIAHTDGVARIRTENIDTEVTHFFSEFSQNFILGYTLGIGYRLPGQPIGIDLIYNQDLTPFYNLRDLAPGTFIGFQLNTWRRSIGLRVNYHF